MPTPNLVDNTDEGGQGVRPKTNPAWLCYHAPFEPKGALGEADSLVP